MLKQCGHVFIATESKLEKQVWEKNPYRRHTISIIFLFYEVKKSTNVYFVSHRITWKCKINWNWQFLIPYKKKNSETIRNVKWKVDAKPNHDSRFVFVTSVTWLRTNLSSLFEFLYCWRLEASSDNGVRNNNNHK